LRRKNFPKQKCRGDTIAANERDKSETFSLSSHRGSYAVRLERESDETRLRPFCEDLCGGLIRVNASYDDV
jgi:hypothetical protein